MDLSSADSNACNFCMLKQKKSQIFVMLNQALFSKYAQSQNYYYTKDINEYIRHERNIKTIYFQYNTDYGQVNEHLKTFYPFYKGLSILDEMTSYYKYYYEIPRFFNQPLNEIIIRFHKYKRNIYYQKVKRELNPEPKDKSVLETYRNKSSSYILKTFLQEFHQKPATNVKRINEDITIYDIQDQLNKIFKQSPTSQFTFSFLENQNITSSDSKMLNKLLKYDFKTGATKKQKPFYMKDLVVKKINNSLKNNSTIKTNNSLKSGSNMKINMNSSGIKIHTSLKNSSMLKNSQTMKGGNQKIVYQSINNEGPNFYFNLNLDKQNLQVLVNKLQNLNSKKNSSFSSKLLKFKREIYKQNSYQGQINQRSSYNNLYEKFKFYNKYQKNKRLNRTEKDKSNQQEKSTFKDIKAKKQNFSYENKESQILNMINSNLYKRIQQQFKGKQTEKFCKLQQIIGIQKSNLKQESKKQQIKKEKNTQFKKQLMQSKSSSVLDNSNLSDIKQSFIKHIHKINQLQKSKEIKPIERDKSLKKGVQIQKDCRKSQESHKSKINEIMQKKSSKKQ